MTQFQYISTDLQNDIATLTLDRTDVHNAFNAEMIKEMIAALDDFQSAGCRLLILNAKGKHFSAGADLHWMKQQITMTYHENVADAKQLARLMQSLDRFPHPTLALVNGAAYGGALGLICACDIAVANNDAKFCLSEVKIGLLPAVISPYVIRTIGERQSRRYMLTAEVFDASQALTMGLIHQISDDLTSAKMQFSSQIMRNSPQAVSQCKQLIHKLEQQPIDDVVIDLTSKQIADIRISTEGQEGLTAFLNKRQPNWITQG